MAEPHKGLLQLALERRQSSGISTKQGHKHMPLFGAYLDIGIIQKSKRTLGQKFFSAEVPFRLVKRL